MRIITCYLAITMAILISGCFRERPIYFIKGTSKEKCVILDNKCGDTYSYRINMISDKELLGIDNSSNDLFSGNEYTSLPGERKIYKDLISSKEVYTCSNGVQFTFIIKKDGKPFRIYTKDNFCGDYMDDFLKFERTMYYAIDLCGGNGAISGR